MPYCHYLRGTSNVNLPCAGPGGVWFPDRQLRGSDGARLEVRPGLLVPVGLRANSGRSDATHSTDPARRAQTLLERGRARPN